MLRIIRLIMGLLVSLIMLVIATLAVVAIFRIPIDLTRFKEPLENIVSEAIGRPVQIEDSIVISTSLEPYITVQGLRIDNPKDFRTDTFLFMNAAKIQIELYPLFTKKIHISEILVQGLDLTLEENTTGKTNWVFQESTNIGDVSSGKKTPQHTNVVTERNKGLSNDSLVVRKLKFDDIKIDYHKPNGGEPSRLHLANCLGSMVPGAPLHLDIDGNVLGHDYMIDVSIASLEEFLLQNKSWVEIKADIAKTILDFKGVVNLVTASKSLTMQMIARGEKLSDLNLLLNIDLPPFDSYEVDTELHLQSNRFDLRKLLVSTGSSSLKGDGSVTRIDGFTTIDLQLHSPVIQINDFVFDEWSWSVKPPVEGDIPQPDKVKENSGLADKEDLPEDRSQPKQEKLLSPEFLAKFNCSLLIEADKVRSGEDFLGSGLLNASVKKGRVTVSPLSFALPGGKITMSASVKPGTEKSEADLAVEIQNFDIGVLVRRTKPESDMGGFVNLNVDLHSSAATIPELLAHGNGYFDFSGKLENFGAGIIDLWAVNLVAAIVSSTESRSQLNCAVGRWTARDGLLQSDAFFIDTSKIRICAKGQVDFTKNRVDLVVNPKAKKAEFFSLATPLKVHGTFSDLNIGVKRGGIAETAVRFIASPAVVPLKRTFTDRIPKNGSDVCAIELGPTDRSKIEIPLCTN